jgi:hypothetical protein
VDAFAHRLVVNVANHLGLGIDGDDLASRQGIWALLPFLWVGLRPERPVLRGAL